jgi:DNA-binding transcriptional MerR regulator
MEKRSDNEYKAEYFFKPDRIEVAELGLIDLSQIQGFALTGIYEIYEGEWDAPDKKMVARVVPSTKEDLEKIFYGMVKERLLISDEQVQELIKRVELSRRAKMKQQIVRETGYKTANKNQM